MNFHFSIFRAGVFCAAILSLSAASAKYSVTGRIVDTDAEPLPSAVYRIFNANDTVHSIVNNVTANDGTFTQTITAPGDYILTTDYVGLTSARRSFSVSDGSPVASLGDIELTPSDVMLEGVTVVAKKAVVVSDGANIKYNVAEDPTAQNNTVLEMLRKVPMVTVDGQDNIRVNGSSNFQIYLNGKPNPMFSSEPQRVLKSMPASSITRIEVLTEPGAKYDAEGTGGILNIVIESGAAETVDGQAGSLSLNFGNMNNYINGYIRAKRDKVTGSATVTYSKGGLFHLMENSREETEYLSDDVNHYHISEFIRPKGNEFDYLSGNVSLSWEPNKLNLFTLSADVTSITSDMDSYGTGRWLNSRGDLNFSNSQTQDVNFQQLSLTVNAAHQHSFTRPDHNITTSFQYSHGGPKIKAYTFTGDYVGADLPDQAYRINNETDNNEYTLQVDYHNTITSHHTMEFGAKGLLTDNHNTSDQFTGTSRDDLVEDMDNYVKMRQYRDIAALYGSYTGTFGPLTAVGGLRYEHTHMGVDFKSAGRKDFSSRLDDVVPNASLSFAVAPTAVLRLAYNMRISRPSIDNLNPYVWQLDPWNVRTGNPDLKSQTSNNVSVGYSFFSPVISMNVRAEYAHVGDMISQITDLRDGVIYTTVMNAGRHQSTSLNAFVNWRITNTMSLSLNGTASYVDIRVKKMDLQNSGWTGNFGANFDYALPCKLRINAYGGMSARNVSLQGSWGGWNYYGIGFSRDFLKDDALTLSLSASNMFQKYNTFKNRTETADVITTSIYKAQRWNVGIGIQWNFGKLKTDVKRLNEVDNNDAVKTGGGNGSMGGIGL